MITLVMIVDVTASFCEGVNKKKQDPQQYTANNGRWAHTKKTLEELERDSSKCMAGGKKYLSIHGGSYEDVHNYWTRCMDAKGYEPVDKRKRGPFQEQRQ